MKGYDNNINLTLSLYNMSAYQGLYLYGGEV